MATKIPFKQKSPGGSAAPPAAGIGGASAAHSIVMPMVVFGDLRDLELAERKKLDEERQRLEVVKKRRGLSKEQQALLDEIREKLDPAHTTVVDPMFKAAQEGLKRAGVTVPDHKGGRY